MFVLKNTTYVFFYVYSESATSVKFLRKGRFFSFSTLKVKVQNIKKWSRKKTKVEYNQLNALLDFVWHTLCLNILVKGAIVLPKINIMLNDARHPHFQGFLTVFYSNFDNFRRIKNTLNGVRHVWIDSSPSKIPYTNKRWFPKQVRPNRFLVRSSIVYSCRYLSGPFLIR